MLCKTLGFQGNALMNIELKQFPFIFSFQLRCTEYIRCPMQSHWCCSEEGVFEL